MSSFPILQFGDELSQSCYNYMVRLFLFDKRVNLLCLGVANSLNITIYNPNISMRVLHIGLW